MANFNELKTAIAEVIKQNGNEEITGDVLQYVLIEMVTALGGGQRFGGVITTESDPAATDGAMFYVGGHGTYTNLSGIEVTVGEGQFGIFMFNGTWTARVITVAKPVDAAITEDGKNPVEGGAIYAEFEKLREAGYLFAGLAVPSTRPAQNLTERIFYIATQAGNYQYFGGGGLNLDRGFNIISFDGESWTNVLVFAMTDTVSDGGTGLVTSGGVFDVVKEKVDKEEGKGLSQENFTTNEKNKLHDLPTASEIAEALALKQNVLTFDNEPMQGSSNPVKSGGVYDAIKYFITRSVDDLINYYTKSNTYNKTEINDLLAGIVQFQYEVVGELPEASAQTMNKIYLVPSPNPELKNVKDEYITIRKYDEFGHIVYDWEQIGTTTVDLSGYYTSAQTDAAITAALNEALASYSTTAEMQEAISTAIATALAEYYTKAEIDAMLDEARGTLATLTLTASTDLVKVGVGTSVGLVFKSNVAATAITLKRGASVITSGTGKTLEFSDLLLVADEGTVVYTAEAVIGGQTRTVTVSVDVVEAVYYGGGTDASQIVNTPSARRTPAGRYAFNIAQAESSIFVLVPMSMDVSYVTLGGLEVPMEPATGIVVESKPYKCYQSSNTYDAGSYVINVF